MERKNLRKIAFVGLIALCGASLTAAAFEIPGLGGERKKKKSDDIDINQILQQVQSNPLVQSIISRAQQALSSLPANIMQGMG